MLSFSSVYWLSGVYHFLSSTFSCATRIITTDAYSPELYLELIGKYKVTRGFASTFQFIQMVKLDETTERNLSSVNLIVVGGSKVPNDIFNSFKEKFPNGTILVGYGLSELGGGISFEFPFTGDDSVGNLVSNVQAKIIDDNGNRLGINEIGEICAKKPNYFSGYYNDPESSAKLIDNEDFIRTGDVGRFDENGKLHILIVKRSY